MQYAHYTTEAAALARVAAERHAGRMAYMLTLREGCYEVRSWG